MPQASSGGATDFFRVAGRGAHLGVPPVIAHSARVAERLGPVRSVAPERRRLRVAVRAALPGDAREEPVVRRDLHNLKPKKRNKTRGT